MEKAEDNINCLKQALDQQNRLATRLLRQKDEAGSDIESPNKKDRIFKSLTPEERERMEQDEREMNEEEKQLLAQFDKNDQEIDQMLGVVINQLDKLQFSAQGITQEIDKQGKLLKKLNQRIEVSWTKLERRDNDLKKVLDTYRSQNKFCCDVLLILLVIALLYFVIWLYRAKGYLWELGINRKGKKWNEFNKIFWSNLKWKW